MSISEVLADRLVDEGLTQEAAAQRIGVKQSVVSRWVAGKDAPSDRYVPALVKFTGLTKRQVLDSIHQQKLAGARSTPARITALEAEVAELREMFAELRAEVRRAVR